MDNVINRCYWWWLTGSNAITNHRTTNPWSAQQFWWLVLPGMPLAWWNSSRWSRSMAALCFSWFWRGKPVAPWTHLILVVFSICKHRWEGWTTKYTQTIAAKQCSCPNVWCGYKATGTRKLACMPPKRNKNLIIWEQIIMHTWNKDICKDPAQWQVDASCSLPNHPAPAGSHWKLGSGLARLGPQTTPTCQAVNEVSLSSSPGWNSGPLSCCNGEPKGHGSKQIEVHMGHPTKHHLTISIDLADRFSIRLWWAPPSGSSQKSFFSGWTWCLAAVPSPQFISCSSRIIQESKIASTSPKELCAVPKKRYTLISSFIFPRRSQDLPRRSINITSPPKMTHG